ncbi:NPCBM/NEW2 domain-containing protein [Deinococcus sp. YIM 77859]|uniref:NPCBM/NEW2 domain-containing protein n=1 Tax=Deinococcus sp. YIM 77859 TaxID=1540221 RepID=UPI000691D124|nr:NPCBM/NEW2 domain-containing protein [Deinococcus sp. YIM 77859]
MIRPKARSWSVVGQGWRGALLALALCACARTELAAPLPPQTIDPGDNTLSYEPFLAQENGWGPAERDTSNGEAGAGDGRPLTLNGKTYSRGFGVHANSSLSFAIDGKCSALTADIGVDDEVGARGSVVFQVYGDGVKLFESGVMTGTSAAERIQVELRGRRTLTLVVHDAGDGNQYDHADWAAPQLLGCDPAAPAPGPQAIRINAGGPAQVVDGVRWEGCEAVNACQGYVRGGFAYTERPLVAISGVQPPANEALYQSEWTGGETTGVPAGGVAFGFQIPVANGAYLVRLHFAELNKYAVGKRIFDVNLEGRTVLPQFDVFEAAGGLGRALVREFPVTVNDGELSLDFIRRVENAKLSALEVLPRSASLPAELTAQPERLIFSGVQNEVSAPQAVVLRNTGDSPLRLERLGLTGSGSGAFELVAPPTVPITLEPGQSLTLQVRLAPRGQVGSLHAGLRVEGDRFAREIKLSGLSARGREGNLEPTLAQIVDALGYAVDVGGTELLLGTSPNPIGDEVTAPLFERAGAGPVTLRPVARYSPDGPSPYGTYTLEGGVPRLQPRATLVAGQAQNLNPAIEPGGSESFSPGDEPFGVYLAANGYAAQNTYTQDTLNTGPIRHAVRVYPLKDAAGQPLPNSYLLGFEPAQNGDYQDVVFILQNVRPVAAPAGLAWTERGRAPTTLYEGQGAAVNGRLYVFGGFDKNLNNVPIATTAAHMYDPASDQWRRLRDLPEPLTHAGLAVDGQAIYLAGGFLGNHPGPQTDHVWKYDVASDTWSAMPPLPAARGGGALVRLGRELHFFGGTQRSGLRYLRDFGDHWVLSLDNPSGWRAAAPLPNPRNHLSGAVLNGRIYAIGGQHLGDEDAGNQADVHVYDPQQDAWRAVRPLPRPMGHATASTVSWNGRIVVMGGVTQGAREIANVIEYDPQADTWTELTPLPGPRQSPVADVVAGQLVVVTGSTADGPTDTVWIGTR